MSEATRTTEGQRRRAVVAGNGKTETDLVKKVGRYLPANYEVVAHESTAEEVVVEGVDHAGWTLDGYVIPRLASGLYAVREVDVPAPTLRRLRLQAKKLRTIEAINVATVEIAKLKATEAEIDLALSKLDGEA